MVVIYGHSMEHALNHGLENIRFRDKNYFVYVWERLNLSHTFIWEKSLC